ncbi:disrupted in schizophrenia 1 protein isoform X2 [Misgurnus anguillicaudatus]|uniref:disrupted in schizophrenia 1 protein isoform X2 n=1 Tax=Misgurnus anguillicaudatus TaxID=75329 RepID=UPI003CCEFC1E
MMFAGMIRVESKSTTQKNDNNAKCYRCAVRSDGASVTVESESRHRRSFRRPGYMRADPVCQVDVAASSPAKTSCDSHRNSEIPNSVPSTTNIQTFNSELPSSPGEKWLKEIFERDDSSNGQIEETSRSISSCDVFNSSFSFIQQSLETGDLLDLTTGELSPSQYLNKRSESTSWDHPELLNSSGTIKPVCTVLGNNSVLINQSEPEVFTLGQLPCPIGRSVKPKRLLLDKECWLMDLDVSWCHRDTQISSSMSIQDSDSGSLDTEVTSSISVDSSDSTSSSSVTSGYDSATPSADQSRNGMKKKCEDILQDCLRNSRTNAKIESMMLKLHRLQHRAVLDDDYDAAERFGKKLDDLRRERATLNPALPSRHPAVSEYLQQLRTAVHSALQRTSSQCTTHDITNRKENREKDESSEDQKWLASSTGQHQTREHLIWEKQRIQKEMLDLQRRLEELQVQSRAVDMQLGMEVHRLEVEMPMLRGCDVGQLHLIGRALEDMMTSEHRAQISASPPAEIMRLQEQEQALNLSIKETTAKMLMSQKLGGSLRRKVSETETQLLALQEAKLAAISGNDFSSAKELKAEIRNVYGERDRLETLLRKLHTLSTGSGQELTRMKEKQNQIKLDLQWREAQHERSLKESILKYIELLEEQRHSCESPALEHIWEADLEACHLLLKGQELRTPSLSETEDVPPMPSSSSNAFTEEEADCAMLTALGGRWCPDANLQHSEFTKKLEEFLFCVEDSPKDLCEEAVELTVRCDVISDRLHYLEDQLQMAMENHDKDLALSLEKEVQEVKATLHAMLSQLKQEDDNEEEDDDDDEEDKYCDVEEEQLEDGHLEEDLYFSDSWDI